MHGGWGLTSLRNPEGKQILDFPVACDMAVTNSSFKTAQDQYITYKSGRSESQTDFLLSKRNHLVVVKNSKVIKGECVARQHHLVGRGL